MYFDAKRSAVAGMTYLKIEEPFCIANAEQRQLDATTTPTMLSNKCATVSDSGGADQDTNVVAIVETTQHNTTNITQTAEPAWIFALINSETDTTTTKTCTYLRPAVQTATYVRARVCARAACDDHK